ncbi:MAG: HXXEE domain-containing protein [Devosia sp.]
MATNIWATIFTVAVLATGLLSLGLATMLIFTTGFVGGLVLFLLRPGLVPFARIKGAYWICLVLFVLHRTEEYATGFFDALAGVTGVDKPDPTSLPVVLLVGLSVGAWLLVPVLCGRIRFGTYLAWTFFAAMGITELAHIGVFPFIVGRPLAYFPGMATTLLLAPVAWWGILLLWREARPETQVLAR